MKDNILVFGGGFMGKRIQEAFACQLSERWIEKVSDAEDEIKKNSAGLLINCIGFTGRNVDDCESNIDTTLKANTFVPLMLAEAALRRNIPLVHISSGCIYHYDYAKDAPIPEDKSPDYYSLFYSRTKIYSERALLALSGHHPILIARVRIPLDNRPHPKNLLDKLIRYKKVIDVPNSVTYIPDFLRALEHLISMRAFGIYNIVNDEGLKYKALMEEYRRFVPDFSYEVVDFRELNIVRTNLILSTEKLKLSGFKVRSIYEVLEECVKGCLKL